MSTEAPVETKKQRMCRYMKELVARRKAAGLCIRCGKAKAVPGKNLCEVDAALDAQRAKALREEHRAKGLCTFTASCTEPVVPGRACCAVHDAKERARTKTRTAERRLARGLDPVPPTPRPKPRPPYPPTNCTSNERREVIRAAFIACGGNGQAAAKQVGASRGLVNSLARRFGWREGLPPRPSITEPKRHVVFGESLTLTELAEASGESRNAIKIRIRRGRTPEQAAFQRTPRQRRPGHAA